MPSRQYDFTLPATIGATRTLQVVGSVCRVVSAPAGAVRIKTTSGSQYDCEAGQGFRLPAGEEFRELFLSNINGLAQTGAVFIGDDTFEDTRVPGVVSVADASITLSGADKIYTGSVSSGLPAAGLYGNLQIWNGAPNKGFAIKRLTVLQSTLAQSIRLRTANAQATGATAQMGSHRFRFTGGGLGTGSIVMVANATGTAPSGNDQPGLNGGMNWALNVPAGAAQTPVPGLESAPILLAPSTGLYLSAETAVSDYRVLITGELFDWNLG